MLLRVLTHTILHTVDFKNIIWNIYGFKQSIWFEYVEINKTNILVTLVLKKNADLNHP